METSDVPIPDPGGDRARNELAEISDEMVKTLAEQFGRGATRFQRQRALLRASARCAGARCGLVLSGASGQLRRVLEMSGVRSVVRWED